MHDSSLLGQLLSIMYKYDVFESDVTHVQTINGFYECSFDEFRGILADIDYRNNDSVFAVSMCAVMAGDVYFAYSWAWARWVMCDVVEPLRNSPEPLSAFFKEKVYKY